MLDTTSDFDLSEMIGKTVTNNGVWSTDNADSDVLKF
jgi:hypothetical protein